MSVVVTSGGETVYQSTTTDEGVQLAVALIAGTKTVKTFTIYLLDGSSVVANGGCAVSIGSTVIDDDTVYLTATIAISAPVDIDAIQMRMAGETANFSEATISGTPLHLDAGTITVREAICLSPYDADSVDEELI